MALAHLLAAAALVLGLAPSAQATRTNVVPNPGFEQGGCGSTPVICGWLGDGIFHDTYAHSGSYGMSLGCGATGCGGSISAHIEPAACPAIGRGTHPASFWSSGNVEAVSFGATFYSGPGCTGEALGADSIGGSTAGGGWQELTGTMRAPRRTHSAYLYVGGSAQCEDLCNPSAYFDDLDLERRGGGHHRHGPRTAG